MKLNLVGIINNKFLLLATISTYTSLLFLLIQGSLMMFSRILAKSTAVILKAYVSH
jgi:hypothetical protein